MSLSYKIDNVIVDKMGWASITRRNTDALNIRYGDRFYMGIDLDERHESFQSLFFIKVRESDSFDEFGKVIEFNERRLRGGFQLNPVLRLLNVKPPFICEIRPGGKDFDFSFQLPNYKGFILGEEVQTMLRPLSEMPIYAMKELS